ncbi:hypothetical protein CCP3SC15_1920011 [Gammaproteobacteria bacterium]
MTEKPSDSDAMANYSRPENAMSKLLDVADPFSPYKKWARRSIGFWRERKNVNVPRRVSRKPNHVRTRVKKAYDIGYYKRNSEKLRLIEEKIDGMLQALR